MLSRVGGFGDELVDAVANDGKRADGGNGNDQPADGGDQMPSANCGALAVPWVLATF